MAQNGPAICHRAAQLGFNARDFRISREADRNRRAIRHNPGAGLLAAGRRNVDLVERKTRLSSSALEWRDGSQPVNGHAIRPRYPA